MTDPVPYREVPGTHPVRLRSETLAACPHCGARIAIITETAALAVERGPHLEHADDQHA
jgi:hypothetical protein